MWTIGGSGPSSSKRGRKLREESLLATMNSTKHPFSAIEDTSSELGGQANSPSRCGHIQETTSDVYELKQMSTVH